MADRPTSVAKTSRDCIRSKAPSTVPAPPRPVRPRAGTEQPEQTERPREKPRKRLTDDQGRQAGSPPTPSGPMRQAGPLPAAAKLGTRTRQRRQQDGGSTESAGSLQGPPAANPRQRTRPGTLRRSLLRGIFFQGLFDVGQFLTFRDDAGDGHPDAQENNNSRCADASRDCRDNTQNEGRAQYS